MYLRWGTALTGLTTGLHQKVRAQRAYQEGVEYIIMPLRLPPCDPHGPRGPRRSRCPPLLR